MKQKMNRKTDDMKLKTQFTKNKRDKFHIKLCQKKENVNYQKQN